jgi:hypothetical protein
MSSATEKSAKFFVLATKVLQIRITSPKSDFKREGYSQLLPHNKGIL